MKLVTRIVALILIPVLIGDPVSAVDFIGEFSHPTLTTRISTDLFTLQAVNVPSATSPHQAPFNHETQRLDRKLTGSLRTQFEQEISRYIHMLNQTARPKPTVLEKVDLDQNAREMIQSLPPAWIHLSEAKARALTQALHDYFEEERLVHRVNMNYLDRGRLAFLTKESHGMMLAGHDLRDLIIRFSDVLDSQGFVAGGIGTGHDIAIDALIGSVNFLSSSLDLAENFQTNTGGSFGAHAGLMVIFTPQAKAINHLIAVNAPDTVHLDFWGAHTQDEWLSRQLLSLQGLQDVREEMVRRFGLDTVYTIKKGLITQKPYSPLDDREVEIPNGAGPDFVERIVVMDTKYPLVKELAAGTPLADKIVSASEYAARDAEGHYRDPRLRRGEEARQRIKAILASPEDPRSVSAPQPHKTHRDIAQAA